MIRQRFLYIGIGGSGLDIGRELSDALTKEICGLDGRRLVDRGGPFAGFEPGQLPSFVQSVYLDFSSQALDEIKTHLRGKNAVAATNILPPHNSYLEAADDLRTQLVPTIQEWVPHERDVNVAPLSAGAGQYPNVGRVALFAALRRAGYSQTLGQQLGGAIDRLAQSMGQLTSYAGDVAHTSSIAVYIGFSLSGGTGCGIYYDLVHLLYNELVTKLSDVSCTIMPVIIMPSLFDDVLVGSLKRNTQLNAATALLDLSRLMDLFNSPDPQLANERRITYPWTSGEGQGSYKEINLDAQYGKTSVKVATLVGKHGGLKRKDVYRSIASAIVSQVSTVAEVDQQTMGFVDKLVNDNDIRDPHHTLLGRRNIMPAVSASLTLPSERLVEVISRRLLGEGLQSQIAALPNRTISDDDVKVFLKGSGQGDLAGPRDFRQEVGLELKMPASATSKTVFEQAKVQLGTKITQAKTAISGKISQRIFEIKDFGVYAGLAQVLATDPTKTLPDALQVGNVATAVLSGRGFSSDAPSPRKPKKRAGDGLVGVFKRKITAGEIDRHLKQVEKQFVADVQTDWWTQWNNSKAQWDSSVQAGTRVLRELLDQLGQLDASSEEQLRKEVVRLQQPSLGVVEFLPTDTGSMEKAVLNLVREVQSRLRIRLNVNQEDMGQLLSAVLRSGGANTWVEALKRFESTTQRDALVETLMVPIRKMVSEELGSILPSLGELLARLATSDGAALSSELDQLRAALAGLLPDGVIPPPINAKPRVLVTYPGEKSSEVESMIEKAVFGGRYAGLNDRSVYQFAASPEGSTLTATINIVGQGLLDNQEVREIFRLWQSANNEPQMTDKLMWRQRVSFRNLDDLTDVTGRRLILRNFLGALYDGHISVVSGSLDRPETIRITKEGTTASLELKLRAQHGASPWASFYNAYEEAIVASGALHDKNSPEVIRWFGTYVPKALYSVDDSSGLAARTPSPVFEEFMAIAASAVERGADTKTYEGLSEDAILHHMQVARFWQHEVQEGMLAPYFLNGLTFWCIAGGYSLAGRSEVIKSQLGGRLRDRDALTKQRIKEELVRKNLASGLS